MHVSLQKPTPHYGEGSTPTAGGVDPRLRSAEEARQWFQDRGKTVVDWAMRRGFNPGLVTAVLNGKRKCLRGQSYEIAVALRLKATPMDDDWDPDEEHSVISGAPNNNSAYRGTAVTEA